MSLCYGTMIGKFDRYIEIQSDSDTQNTLGEDVETWSTLANVWAEKMQPTVAEQFTGEQFVGTRRIAWRIRYRTDVNNLCRVVYEGQNYFIEGVYEQGYKKELILVTKAILDRP